MIPLVYHSHKTHACDVLSFLIDFLFSPPPPPPPTQMTFSLWLRVRLHFICGTRLFFGRKERHGWCCATQRPGRRPPLNYSLSLKTQLVPLLGKQASEAMGLITINYHKFENVVKLTVSETGDIFTTFADVFDYGQGNLPGISHFEVNTTADLWPLLLVKCLSPWSLTWRQNLTDWPIQMPSFLLINLLTETAAWWSLR